MADPAPRLGVLSRRPTARVASAVSAAGALTLLYTVDPQHTRVPLCPFHAMTGLWCPFCGSTRAAHEWLHGHVATALSDNALLLVFAPYLALVALRVKTAVAGELPGRRGRALRAIFAGCVVAFTIVRNLPSGRCLAPPR